MLAYCGRPRSASIWAALATAIISQTGSYRSAYLASFAFAFAAAQSALLISTKPLPLQEFWPLQELLALLQADWPLQEFTPVQCTVSSAAAAVPTKAVPKSIAAAVATATP